MISWIFKNGCNRITKISTKPPASASAASRWLVLTAALVLAVSANAQLSYSKGQVVSPAYEGWERNDDGSYTVMFGYMNSNWEEELDVPIGPENKIEPGMPGPMNIDQGQPTHFFPRRNRFIFRVRVPKDFGEKELVWTLTTHGKTVKAYATLKQDYFLDNMVFTSETGAIGAGVSSPAIRANKPPVLKVDGDSARNVKVGQPLSLSAHVTDDGVPRVRQRGDPDDRTSNNDLRLIPPRQITVGSSTGLWTALYVYRGEGRVHFDTVQVKTWEDTRAGANSQWAPRWVAPPAPADGNWKVNVTFDDPGTYVMRWHATDGALWADENVTVVVTR